MKAQGANTITIYNFDPRNQKFVSIDDVPDFRTEAEKTLSPLSTFNHSKPDLGYAERYAEEAINLAGAPMRIYLRQIDFSEGIDNDFDEDAHPVYSQPIIIKGYFKPEPKSLELMKFGITAKTTATITFSRAVLLNNPAIGDRLILAGDVIQIPYNDVDEKDEGPLTIRVNTTSPTGNYHYRFLYHQVIGEPISADELVAPPQGGPVNE